MFVAALLCGLAVGVSAQSPNKIVKGIENYSRHGNTISMIERGVVKSGYHYRMKAFRTNDNYQTDQFSYNEQMLKRFVLIRHFDNPKITDYNRISIGSDEQMDIFLERLTEVLNAYS